MLPVRLSRPCVMFWGFFPLILLCLNCCSCVRLEYMSLHVLVSLLSTSPTIRVLCETSYARRAVFVSRCCAQTEHSSAGGAGARLEERSQHTQLRGAYQRAGAGPWAQGVWTVTSQHKVCVQNVPWPRECKVSVQPPIGVCAVSSWTQCMCTLISWRQGVRAGCAMMEKMCVLWPADVCTLTSWEQQIFAGIGLAHGFCADTSWCVCCDRLLSFYS